VRWQFERAVWSLGRHVERAIDEMRMARHKNGKPKYSDEAIERAVKEMLNLTHPTSQPLPTRGAGRRQAGAGGRGRDLSSATEVRQAFGGLVGPPK